jgi:Zn-dependent protease with chaperone function
LDVQDATDAWLARLPDAQRLAAQSATDTQLAGWIAGVLVFLAVAVLLARLGAPVALARRIDAARPRPWLAVAAAAGVTALALASAKALVDAGVAWRLAAILGMRPAPSFAACLAAAASQVLPSVAAAVVLVPPLAWLIRRRPKSWPLIVGGAAAALILALGWLPYALSAGPAGGPAPPGPVQASVAQLMAQTGLPAPAVLLAPDPGLDADVTGGFGRARVVVGRRLLAGPPAEARAYVGHLMGHYAHSDILIVCLVIAALVLAGCFAAQRWTAPLARAMGARDVRSPAAPAALPALAIIGAATLTLAALGGAAYLRWANVGADAYSLDHAREPDGLVAVIEDEWARDPGHDAVAPSPLEAVLFYTHPPLKDRIGHAMAWKASQKAGR